MKHNILKVSTDVVRKSQDDVFTDFSLPTLIHPLVKEKTFSFFNRFCDLNMFGSVLSKLQSKHLEVQIPAEFQEKLRKGIAHLGSKAEGCFTTTIYESGHRGAVGQLYLKENVDPKAVSDVLSNISMYGMLQKISGQLNEIKANQKILLEGQRTDRLGSIIGGFQAYVLAYPTFESETERRNASFSVYRTMRQGLCQVHFELDTLARELQNAPDNAWNNFLAAITNPMDNIADKKEQAYNRLVYGLYKYYNMLKLSDIILLERGANADVIANNHKSIESFCLRVLNEDMEKKVDYLTGGDMTDYHDIRDNIFSYTNDIKEKLIPSFNKTFNLDISMSTDRFLEFSNQ